MKTKLFALVLLAGGSLFAETHWSIGIGLGAPYYYGYAPPPPPVVVYTPPSPSPEYTWVPGYYYPARGGYAWHAGFWSRPPYAGAFWVAPRYYEHHYYPGYWERRERHWDRDDHDERWEHHDRGWHRGWYKHHDDD